MAKDIKNQTWEEERQEYRKQYKRNGEENRKKKEEEKKPKFNEKGEQFVEGLGWVK